MHFLTLCAVILVFAIFLDRSRVKAKGLFFVLKDHARRISRWMTLKRIVYAIGILIFVLAAWQAMGFDWAFVAIGGDAMLYLEIASATYLVAVRGHLQLAAKIVVRAISGKFRKAFSFLRSRRWDRRGPRRDLSGSHRSDDDMEPAVLKAFAFS